MSLTVQLPTSLTNIITKFKTSCWKLKGRKIPLLKPNNHCVYLFVWFTYRNLGLVQTRGSLCLEQSFSLTAISQFSKSGLNYPRKRILCTDLLVKNIPLLRASDQMIEMLPLSAASERQPLLYPHPCPATSVQVHT